MHGATVSKAKRNKQNFPKYLDSKVLIRGDTSGKSNTILADRDKNYEINCRG